MDPIEFSLNRVLIGINRFSRILRVWSLLNLKQISLQIFLKHSKPALQGIKYDQTKTLDIEQAVVSVKALMSQQLIKHFWDIVWIQRTF